MLPTRDPPEDKRPTQIASKGLETNFPSKRTGKKGQGSNTHIRQNRLQKKVHKEIPRRPLQNTQRKNPLRRHKHCKYICTQHRSTQIHKENLRGLQKRYVQQHIYSRGFYHPLSKRDRPSKQNINKDIVALNNALDEMDLTDVYRAFHPKEAKYTFFSSVHGTFSKIDHMIGHKTSLNKFKKIEIISSIFYNHKELKLETNLKEKTPKY